MIRMIYVYHKTEEYIAVIPEDVLLCGFEDELTVLGESLFDDEPELKGILLEPPESMRELFEFLMDNYDSIPKYFNIEQLRSR
jgi:hypothetical protein